MESQARLPMVLSMREQPARESDDWARGPPPRSCQVQHDHRLAADTRWDRGSARGLDFLL